MTGFSLPSVGLPRDSSVLGRPMAGGPFTTAMRMVTRAHGGAAHVGRIPIWRLRPALPNLMLLWSTFAHRCQWWRSKPGVDQTHFTGRQAICAKSPSLPRSWAAPPAVRDDLSAFACFQLNVMNEACPPGYSQCAGNCAVRISARLGPDINVSGRPSGRAGR